MTHHLSDTTHTVEMAQITDLNERLGRRRADSAVTASDLGVAGPSSSHRGPAALSGAAVLVRLSWDGSPEYPYIHGHFATGGPSLVRLELRTATLRRLSRRLGARHIWGVGSAPEPTARD